MSYLNPGLMLARKQGVQYNSLSTLPCLYIPLFLHILPESYMLKSKFWERRQTWVLQRPLHHTE